ncbi:MAG TPA: class I SAM-dependent methyltransferase [Flavisolibacter sp.]|nr:class I SAM-dependent methyltransferase [Flavisolibacter sp.]
MNRISHDINEERAADAFSRQAPVFDRLYGPDVIVQYKRERVREHMRRYLQVNAAMLELNCGTGEDAVYFAASGCKVHATDASPGMLEQAASKFERSPWQHLLSLEQCSFTSLEELGHKGPFDYLYSNFGGLNCTGELEKVLASFTSLVKPGGVVTLVIISRFCLWETLLLFKGHFKTAFRRFFSRRGRLAKVEGQSFRCWYYSPSFVKRQLGPQFALLDLEGLCTIVPPSYFTGFANKYPRIFTFLVRWERRLKAVWPWSHWGDYYIISFRKKA